MSIFSVSYDQHDPDVGYVGVYKVLEKCNASVRILESTWFVKTSKSAEELGEQLREAGGDKLGILINPGQFPVCSYLNKKTWNDLKKLFGMPV